MNPAPKIIDLLHQAVAHHQAGRLDAAEAIYHQILEREETNDNALNLLGLISQSRGQLAEAKSLLERAIAHNPEVPDFHFNLGNVLLSQNETIAALACFQRAVDLKPDHAALLNMGVLLDRMDRVVESAACFQKVVAATPNDVRGHYNLARALLRLARYEEAEAAFHQALSLNPRHLDAHLSLAGHYTEIKRLPEAIHHVREAIKLKPDPKSYSNLGELLRRTGALKDALGAHRAAHAQLPHDAGVLHNYGAALHAAEQYDEAEKVLREAIVRNPHLTKAYVGLAKVYEHQARFSEAIDTLQRALRVEPGSSDMFFKLAALRLATADFVGGWHDYEHRFMTPYASRKRPTPPPYWSGEDVAGKSIYVWTEQGVGDEVLYASMIPDIAARSGQVILECSPRMAPVFVRSFPHITVVSRDLPANEQISPDTSDYQIALASLGQFFRRDFSSFSEHQGYLKADPERAAAFRKKYQAIVPGNRVVGISWRSKHAEIGELKSADITTWTRLLRLPGITFVNLQYGDCGQELATVERNTGVTIFQDPEVDSLRSMDDFFAQVAALDLVISTSNTTVHVAGSLNVPTWLLLPGRPNGLWYWLQGRNDSPWYPSLRIYRGSLDEAFSSSTWWGGIIPRIVEDVGNQPPSP